jgi:hypothetical protein
MLLIPGGPFIWGEFFDCSQSAAGRVSNSVRPAPVKFWEIISYKHFLKKMKRNGLPASSILLYLDKFIQTGNAG